MSTTAVAMLPIPRFSRDPTMPKPKACRNLFGKPNKEELDQFLTTELRTHQEEDCRRYNFDFCSETAQPGRFEWTRSDPQDIPAFYRPVTVSHAKRLPHRTYPSLASEAVEIVPVVQSANTDSNTSALPLDLQARLEGPQPSGSRTFEVEELGERCTSKSTSKTKTTTTKRPSMPSKRRSTTSAPTNDQLKITDFLRQRKRGVEDAGESSSEKRRRSDNSSTSSSPTETL